VEKLQRHVLAGWSSFRVTANKAPLNGAFPFAIALAAQVTLGR